MAHRSLLDLVQAIHSEIGSDSVNDVSDTIDSVSTAETIRQVYFEMIDELDLPPNRKLVALEGLGDLTKPNYMALPENVGSLKWLKYDARISNTGAKQLSDVCWHSPEDFITILSMRNTEDTSRYQLVQYDANITLTIDKLHHPTMWTSFDDEYVIFDAYNSALESTLQSSKSLAYVEFRPTFALTSDHVPELPENLVNVLYLKSLNRCFASKKGMLNPKTERAERRSEIRAQRNKWRSNRVNDLRDGPNYSRK